MYLTLLPALFMVFPTQTSPQDTAINWFVVQSDDELAEPWPAEFTSWTVQINYANLTHLPQVLHICISELGQHLFR